MILKCKMCGGDMEYTQGASVMECPYCGTNQTLPKVDDERLGQMHSRANHLRLMKEFDKAQMIYEEIIAENPKDAEAHWCALLCRYGIEYVEDPYSCERKPTMHRTQFDAITEDVHYLAAVEHADSVAQELYEHEAQLIDRIRRRYLSIASKEEPFDVFICYKETGADGQRTKDSVYAQEIYNELTREGYKVFFARITLEDKLGEAYEPYIFAALGSAKVMLVVGTSAAHMQAEWVKNEWKRYLYLMKQDSRKKIIPVYRDMEAYDMPEEFVYMQAQDYGKIGALQDLVRGVEKIVGKIRNVQSVNQVIYQTSVNAASGKAEPLVRRGMMYLEDGDWSEADQYFDRALDEEPENAQAYIGRLMVSLRCLSKDKLREIPSNFKQDKNYLRAVKYADGQTVSWLTETADHAHLCAERVRLVSVIKKRFHALRKQENERKAKEAVRIHRILSNATEVFNAAKLPKEYNRVKVLLEEIGYEPRAQQLVAQCDAKIEEFKRREEKNNRDIYETAVQRMQTASCSVDYYEIGQKFASIGNYRDSKALAQECAQKEQELRRIENERAEAERKAEEERREQQRLIDERNRQIEADKAKKRNMIIAACAAIAAAAVAAYMFVLEPMMKYNNVDKLIVAGQYEQANDNLVELAEKNYKDAAQRIGEPYYTQAETLLNEAKDHLVTGEYSEIAAANYDKASEAFEFAGTYKDAADRIGEPYYLKAEMYIEEGWYENAADAFRMAGNYRDAEERVGRTYYEWAEMLISMSMYDDASEKFLKAGNYKDALQRVKEPYYIQAERLIREGKRERAVNAFLAAGEYGDAAKRAIELSYTLAQEYEGQNEFLWAALFYRKTGTKDGIAHGNALLQHGKITANYTHSVGILGDGKIVTVGSNENGQRDIAAWKDIISVAAGYTHTVGLKTDGTVVAVGENKYGTCNVGDWKDIIEVAAGYTHTAGLKKDGSVLETGYYLQTREWSNVTSIDARGAYTIGVKSDGSVVIAGFDDKFRQETESWKNIVEASISGGHVVGLKSDGTVVAAGNNNYGQCDVSKWTDIVAIATGRRHTVGLRADGTVVSAGDNSDGQCDVDEWKSVVEIAAGYLHTIGIKVDGSIVAVGNNEYGQIDIDTSNKTKESLKVTALDDMEDNLHFGEVRSDQGLMDKQKIAAYHHTVGLKANGKVVAVGRNDDGQCDVKDWSDIVEVSAGVKHTVGLKSDGTVIAAGSNDDGRCNVYSWTDIAAVSAGRNHTVGLKTDSTLVAVGVNSQGECNVSDWKEIVTVSAGGNHTVGLKADGTVIATGKNNHGQCNVSDWTDIAAVSAGYDYTVGLKANGTVIAVGSSLFDKDNVSKWSDIIAVSAGYEHTVGLKADGTVVAVGQNNIGQCDVGAWKDIVEVQAGRNYTVGLKADGTVVAVGADTMIGECDVDNWNLLK